MNKAPGPNDNWWANHQANCGGTFVKIKEPDNYGKKKPTKRKATSGMRVIIFIYVVLALNNRFCHPLIVTF